MISALSAPLVPLALDGSNYDSWHTALRVRASLLRCEPLLLFVAHSTPVPALDLNSSTTTLDAGGGHASVSDETAVPVSDAIFAASIDDDLYLRAKDLMLSSLSPAIHDFLQDIQLLTGHPWLLYQRVISDYGHYTQRRADPWTLDSFDRLTRESDESARSWAQRCTAGFRQAQTEGFNIPPRAQRHRFFRDLADSDRDHLVKYVDGLSEDEVPTASILGLCQALEEYHRDMAIPVSKSPRVAAVRSSLDCDSVLVAKIAALVEKKLTLDSRARDDRNCFLFVGVRLTSRLIVLWLVVAAALVITAIVCVPLRFFPNVPHVREDNLLVIMHLVYALSV
jgi:hypothetical protein